MMTCLGQGSYFKDRKTNVMKEKIKNLLNLFSIIKYFLALDFKDYFWLYFYLLYHNKKKL